MGKKSQATRESTVLYQTIALGAHQLKVRRACDTRKHEYGMADASGMWEADLNRITVLSPEEPVVGARPPTPSFATCMHEIIHAMLDQSTTHLSLDDQEHVCDLLGERFAELAIRNPEFWSAWV